ncbi:MAG: diacylglycerol kinase family protein [Saprospiraceae bacterium]
MSMHNVDIKLDSSENRHYIFIVNPISGTNKKADYKSIISKYFDKESFEIILTEYRGHATEIANKYSEDANNIVVAVGGDGTINEIAKTLVHKPAKLGIIPVGSGNGFGGHVLKNINIKNCLSVLKNKFYVECDLLSINERICCNTCGIGLSAYVAKIFGEEGKRGLFNYMKLGFGKFSDFPTFNLNIGHTTYYNKISLEIANSSQLGNKAFISPDSSIQDGIFELVLLSKPSIIQVPALVYDVFNKKLNKNKLIQNLNSVSANINLDELNHLHIDGEYIGLEKEIVVKVIPSSLKIII